MHKQRIFIAIYPNAYIAKRLSSIKNVYKNINARWVPIKNIHLTLCFLGWVKSKKVKNIIDIANRVGERHGKCNIELTSICSKKERLIWVQGELNKNIYNLHEDLSKNLDLDVNKFFTPHITLARGNGIPRIKRKIYINFIADNISIVESKLYKTGAEYAIIKTIKLK